MLEKTLWQLYSQGMIEWRDTHEWAAYGGRAEYSVLPSDEIEVLSEKLDAVFSGYVPGLIEGEREPGNDMQRVTFEYSDTSSNARQELVVIDTLFELEYMKYPEGPYVEAYRVNIARQIITDPVEISKFIRAPFIEHYLLLTYRGNDKEAFVDRLDLTKGRGGDMDETPMKVYDQKLLVAELDKIAELYAAAKQERANME